MTNTSQKSTVTINKSLRLDPVFVIGYKRSGTTMMRLMLNKHPDLFIPRESESLEEIPKQYGSVVHQPEDIKNILATLPRKAFKPLIDEDYLHQLLQANLPGGNDILLACLYQSCMFENERGKIRWGDKRPQHWQFVYTLRQWYPNSQFIHIVRDPRDVSASIEDYQQKGVNLSQKNFFWRYIPNHLLYAWQQNFAFKTMKKQAEILGDKRYLRVKYEDLVNNPGLNLQNICKFLELDPKFEAEMLNFQEDAQNVKVSDGKLSNCIHLEQTAKKVNTKSISRYKEIFSEKESKEIEFVCRDLIEEMDYSESDDSLSTRQKTQLVALCRILTMVWGSIRITRRLKGSL